MQEEKCPICGKRLDKEHVEKKVERETIKFCSNGCAKAYEEIGPKREELESKEKRFFVIS
ncbi:MAG: hypothetical protein QXG36_06020 [Nitrososphaeria archaeon]